VLNREVKDLKHNHAAKIQVLDLANQQFQQEHQQVRDCIEHTARAAWHVSTPRLATRSLKPNP
jgi:hypothetical protein